MFVADLKANSNDSPIDAFVQAWIAEGLSRGFSIEDISAAIASIASGQTRRRPFLVVHPDREFARILAAVDWFTHEASDKPNHQVPYYLMLTNEPHDGEPQDFNALRVFTWNTKHHRYETAYREHDLNGVLPASVAKEDFGTKDGTLPTFTIRQRDDSGAITQKKYRMEGVIVKRVYAPGEQPPSSAARRLSASTTPTSKHSPRPHLRRAHHHG